MAEETQALATFEDGTTTEVSVLAPTAVEAMTRGEIDVQISTAKAYPRSLEKFKKTAISMATLDEETAESCIYRRPVGKQYNQKTKRNEESYAEGMSIRMAEIVGASYGNLRVMAQLVEQTPQFVRARGMAIDLETNFASSSEVIESTLTKEGKPFSPRMRVVVAKAALAKARRDATFQVVPKALAKPVEDAVRKTLLGDAQTIDKRRKKVLAWIGEIHIPAERVYAALGISGESDLSVDKLEELTGIRTAIKDGEITLDEAFPPAEKVPLSQKFNKPSPEMEVKQSEEKAPYEPTPLDELLDRAQQLGVTKEMLEKDAEYPAEKWNTKHYKYLNSRLDLIERGEKTVEQVFAA